MQRTAQSEAAPRRAVRLVIVEPQAIRDARPAPRVHRRRWDCHRWSDTNCDSTAAQGGQPKGREVAQARRPCALGNRRQVQQQLGVGATEIDHDAPAACGLAFTRHSGRTPGRWR